MSVYTAVLPTESSASPVEQDRRDHRAANLLLELCRNNGGVYIKVILHSVSQAKVRGGVDCVMVAVGADGGSSQPVGAPAVH